jgi:hypothetical protein
MNSANTFSYEYGKMLLRFDATTLYSMVYTPLFFRERERVMFGY